MKSKALIAIAVAGTFASAGALAGGAKYSTEIQTPASVSESAPWLANESFASFNSTGSMDDMNLSDSSAVGSSASMSGSGTVGHDSTASASGRMSDVDYWLLGSDSDSRGSADYMASSSIGFDSLGTGAASHDSYGMTSSLGASGSTGFDSALSTEPASEDYAVTEVYLVPAPLVAFDGENYWTLDVLPTEDSIDHLASITDLYVITPIYEETIDTSMSDTTAPSDQLSLDMSSELSQDSAG